MRICDLCFGPVSEGNDVVSLEKIASFLEEAEAEMLEDELGSSKSSDGAGMVLGFDFIEGEVVYYSRHLEPVFDQHGRLVCPGDSARMAIISLQGKEEEKAKENHMLWQRVRSLKDAYLHLKNISKDPYNRAFKKATDAEQM